VVAAEPGSAVFNKSTRLNTRFEVKTSDVANPAGGVIARPVFSFMRRVTYAWLAMVFGNCLVQTPLTAVNPVLHDSV
jgi:hypothetical protein